MSKSPDPWARRWPEHDLPTDLRARLPELQNALLTWQRRSGRHDLPWHTHDPYGVWISEVMLQQTQVSTGLYRYPAWMARFPTVQALAAATQDEVLTAWEGLGYYARARNLYAAARQVVAENDGQFPRERGGRLALPGIGPSTASAIAAFAFGCREAIFDGNVARVWARWWGDRPTPSSAAERQRFWWGVAQAATPSEPEDVRTWTQGIMDLGATVCTPRAPKCDQCPWRWTCRARALGTPEAWPIKPVKPPRKAWLIEWVWVVRDGKVAVQQRPPGGPWQGLWALPEHTESAGCPPLASGRHELSHRKISWRIARGSNTAADPAWRWFAPEAFGALALPRPLRRWWTSLSTEERAALFAEDTACR